MTQNEDDMWTCHFIVPPGMEATKIPPEEVVSLALGGCHGPFPVKFDEIISRGVWKTDVAIANKFRSDAGGVFLAGDAAHQLSPVGGHGLNTGLADVFDLTWKLVATMRGWGGEKLLESYDTERREIAHKNLGHVQEALGTVIMPLFGAVEQHGRDTIAANTPEGERVRAEIRQVAIAGHWLHSQNGNMLGYQYTDSAIVMKETTERPTSTNAKYVPTTWAGSRAPHVWMADGETSTLDEFSSVDFNIVDFSADSSLSEPFVRAAKTLGLPLKRLQWEKESNVRKIYERDVVLVRPDMHVAWRPADGVPTIVSGDEARQILTMAAGLPS